MPIIGAVDIALGTLALLRPMRAVLLYMTFWGFLTACRHPLAGEGIWACLERAGNFGVPGAFLVLVWKVGTEWLRPMTGEPLWEFIERGGSYAAPLALLVLRHGQARCETRRQRTR